MMLVMNCGSIAPHLKQGADSLILLVVLSTETIPIEACNWTHDGHHPPTEAALVPILGPSLLAALALEHTDGAAIVRIEHP
jgi:hypothetical protein